MRKLVIVACIACVAVSCLSGCAMFDALLTGEGHEGVKKAGEIGGAISEFLPPPFNWIGVVASAALARLGAGKAEK